MIDCYRYTDTEIKVIAEPDNGNRHKEQNNKAIIDYFTAKKIPYVTQKWTSAITPASCPPIRS